MERGGIITLTEPGPQRHHPFGRSLALRTATPTTARNLDQLASSLYQPGSSHAPSRPAGPPPVPSPTKNNLDTCRRCELWERATQAVPGKGAKEARLMLVGEHRVTTKTSKARRSWDRRGNGYAARSRTRESISRGST